MFINLPLEITSYPLRFIEKHYILLFIVTKIEIISCCCLVTQSCLTLCDPHGLQLATLLCPCNFPGKNTRMGCHFLLHGIFLTKGSNLHILQWQVDSLPLSHLGNLINK